MSNETKLKPSIETVSDEAHSFAEYSAIVEALRPYYESAKSGDGDAIRTAFHDHAHIVGSVNGTFFDMDVNTFGDTVNDGGASPEVAHHIAWIDISGPAAAVKMEFVNWLGFRFTDFFVLYKKDGQWKISGKVYDSHTQN